MNTDREYSYPLFEYPTMIGDIVFNVPAIYHPIRNSLRPTCGDE